ncbi:hypothetical protein HaLaN_13219 [Haematococcus lacustris]|uniref:Uncharacterized protein n=1 Tax=Haematococcus lacustris TaxID=44745 RepID=A0A699ZC15_HAELA|nr:hypothetical protein HaLaN_13219 [Haematococcus lacustris]
MSLSLEQIWTYLQRIRFPLTDRLPRPDLTTLNLVHDLHTRFVVFENLSLLVSTAAVSGTFLAVLRLHSGGPEAGRAKPVHQAGEAWQRGLLPAGRHGVHCSARRCPCGHGWHGGGLGALQGRNQRL